MRFSYFLIIAGALILSAGGAYLFFVQPEEALKVVDLFERRAAIKRVLPSAEKGDAKAQFALAEILDKPNSLFRDPAKALRWYRKAAESGHIEAQFKVGALFAEGRGTVQDFRRASEWFRLAAGPGNHPGAQYALGDLYFHGRGVQHSYGRAVIWYRKAAAKNHPVAQHVLGLMYKKGWGLDYDPVEAFKWFSLALPFREKIVARHPRFDSRAEREGLLRTMNRSQVDRAKRAVSGWKNRN